MVIKYRKEKTLSVQGHKKKIEKKGDEKRKELFMVCILHNINYVIKLPSTSFVTEQIVRRR